MRQIQPALFSLILSLATTGTAIATEKVTTLNDQQAVAVTIYNQNLALIKDRRNIQLKNGESELSFRDVSAKMRPETALLRNTDQPKILSVIEQNFNFDLLTPQKMLEKYVGKIVEIATLNSASGEESIEKAKLLSVQNGVVVQIGNRIETNPRGRYIFPKIPANLRDRPTLTVTLNNRAKGSQPLELSYLTGGLSWKADYVAELSHDDSHLDLLGWVTLDNKSGTTYKQAKLQLVAGDVNQVRPQFQPRVEKFQVRTMMAEDNGVQEESLFDYHLYTLNRLTTLADNQSKQVSLLNAANVAVQKEYLLQGQNYYYRSKQGRIGQKLKIGVFVNFKNRTENSLGLPLPKGIIRVYKKDQSGHAQFVGEDRIDHTPKNESVKLKLGNSFDITADRVQTSYSKKRPSHAHYKQAAQSDFKITLKNAKKEAVVVTVREPIPGDWKIITEDHPHSKPTASTAEWKVSVPAEGEATLAYSVLMQY
ncbi:MAG: DUF4139 domain-containing protein [Gammaproteobacteria bacterium]|nr:MAG: DUF4139 domain-containing protein [Gammaproteobacteria bacterium]